jgi:hypothetical protein
MIRASVRLAVDCSARVPALQSARRLAVAGAPRQAR